MFQFEFQNQTFRMVQPSHSFSALKLINHWCIETSTNSWMVVHTSCRKCVHYCCLTVKPSGGFPLPWQQNPDSTKPRSITWVSNGDDLPNRVGILEYLSGLHLSLLVMACILYLLHSNPATVRILRNPEGDSRLLTGYTAQMDDHKVTLQLCT